MFCAHLNLLRSCLCTLLIIHPSLTSSVQVHGRTLFPAAAMFEMVLAAASMAYQPAAGAGSATTQLLLTGAAIAAPLELKATATVNCTLHCSNGRLEVASIKTSTASRLHMGAHAGVLLGVGQCPRCLMVHVVEQ